MSNKREGTEKAGFSIVSVIHHPFFFILLLIGGLRAFSYQCNKIFDSENIQCVFHFLSIIYISMNILFSV